MNCTCSFQFGAPVHDPTCPVLSQQTYATGSACAPAPTEKGTEGELAINCAHLCPICGESGLSYEYLSTGTHVECVNPDGCHGTFIFPCYVEEAKALLARRTPSREAVEGLLKKWEAEIEYVKDHPVIGEYEGSLLESETLTKEECVKELREALAARQPKGAQR